MPFQISSKMLPMEMRSYQMQSGYVTRTPSRVYRSCIPCLQCFTQDPGEKLENAMSDILTRTTKLTETVKKLRAPHNPKPDSVSTKPPGC